MVERVTAEQIINYAQTQYDVHEVLTPEMLKQTVGGINGVDMETYNKGYTDALIQLIRHFETRV
jgi:hypothetical protein